MFAALLVALAAISIALAILLQRTRVELRTIADHYPAAIAHVIGRDEQLKYGFVNQRYAAMYGRHPSEVIGRHPREVLGAEIFEKAQTNMQRALNGEIVQFDLMLGGKIVQVTYSPDHADVSKRKGFVGVIEDVSELRKLQGVVDA